MSNIIEFLTSKEIMIVYMISAFACVLCLIIYLIEKNNEHVRRKHNTKELNKLVEMVKEQMPELEPEIIYDTPVLEKIEDPSFEVETGCEEENNGQAIEINVKEDNSLEENIEEKDEDIEILEYTSTEPDQETAKQELHRLSEELERDNKLEDLPNIALTNYEEEQEKTAIISLDEFLNRSKEMYAKNEMTQSLDDGNEPISLKDLEERMNRVAAKYDEPFIIANVVSDGEVDENTQVEVINNTIKEQIQMSINTPAPEPIKEEIIYDQDNEEYQDSRKKKFKSSPFISPIFGIQKEATELELENTASFEKLDQQLQKQGDYLVSLKELQGK